MVLENRCSHLHRVTASRIVTNSLITLQRYKKYFKYPNISHTFSHSFCDNYEKKYPHSFHYSKTFRIFAVKKS